MPALLRGPAAQTAIPGCAQHSGAFLQPVQIPHLRHRQRGGGTRVPQQLLQQPALPEVHVPVRAMGWGFSTECLNLRGNDEFL